MNKASANNTPFESKVTSYGGDDNFDFESIGKRIKARIDNYEDVCKKNFEAAKDNRQYVTNVFDDDKLKEQLVDGESPVLVPKIRENVETAIPILTQKTPEPELYVFPRSGNGSPKAQRNIKRLGTSYLKQFWEIDGDMQKRMEQSVRNYYCQRFVCLKGKYDSIKKCAKFYAVPMGKIICPLNDFAETDDLPFVAEMVFDTYSNIIKKHFTDEEGNIDEERKDQFDLKLKSSITNLNDDSRVDYVEYWEADFVAWYYKELTLDVEPNPYWNMSEDEVGNHFDYPKIPYIFENCFGFGDKIPDDATPVDTTKSLADSINKRKRQVDLNADDANGQIVFNMDYVKDEDADNYSRQDQNMLKAYSKNGEPVNLDNVMTIVSGRGIGAEPINDMGHSELHIDNELGTHAVSRGEQMTQETATGRQILKDSDKDRNGTMTRMIERVSNKVFDWLMQFMYVFGDENYLLFNVGSDEEEEDGKADNAVMQTLNRKMLAGYKIKIWVKADSTVPRNPAVQKAEIVDLAKSGMASLKDMYRDLAYDDPDGRAKRAMQEKDPEQAIALYNMDGNADVFNTDAIRHIVAIIGGEMLGDDGRIIYSVDDIEMYQAHLKTQTDYLSGTEVDADLPSFMDLETETQEQLQIHVKLELERFKELQMMEQQMILEQKKAGLIPMDTPMPGEEAPTPPQPTENAPLPEQEPVPVQSSPESVIAPM